MTWNIRLERVVSPSDHTAERYEALEKLVEQLTARVKQLEQNASGQLNQRMKEDQFGVGKKIPRLQFEAITTPNFTLNSDRTKVTKTGKEHGLLQGFLSEQPISAVDNKFAVVFNNVTDNAQCFGVAKRNTPTKNGVCMQKGSWMLRVCDPNFYQSWDNSLCTPLGNKAVFKDGSRFEVSVSPARLLSFELDGTLLHTFELPAGTDELYAAVDLSVPEQSASFV